jgi:hypothetical protein
MVVAWEEGWVGALVGVRVEGVVVVALVVVRAAGAVVGVGSGLLL